MGQVGVLVGVLEEALGDPALLAHLIGMNPAIQIILT